MKLGNSIGQLCPFSSRQPSSLEVIFLNDHCILSRVELVASYQIKDKKEVGEGAKAKWTRKSNLPEVTKSWHDYQVNKLIQ